MIDLVVYSKDRPAQLDLLLRSMDRFFPQWREIDVHVVRLATTEDAERGYARVAGLHPDVRIVDERATDLTFKQITLSLLGRNELTAFMMDDQLFKAPFSLQAPELQLLDDPEVMCLSLRMDPGMDYCYPLDRHVAKPAFERGTVWSWRTAEGDWAYPMSLDTHLFRTRELLPLIERIDFANPNTFEAALASMPLAHPKLACRPVAPTVNVPDNRVQDVCENRAGGGDAAALTARFVAGDRLDLEPLVGMRTRAPHHETPLTWESERRSTGLPRVSVVIPCFQYGRHLAEAVESVLAQAGVDVDVTIVDDGSTDSTPEVARGLVGERVRVITQANSGHPAHARNAGVRAVQADLVLCLDADDRLAPGFLAALAAALEARPDAGVAYGDQQDFGDGTHRHVTPEYDGAKLPHANFLPTASLFRRAAWEAAGGFDAEMGYEDWDFWIGCADAGWPAVKAPGAVFEHRVHGEGQFALDQARHDEVTARILLKRPHLYTDEQLAWARGVTGTPAPAEEAPVETAPTPAEPPVADEVRTFTTVAVADEVAARPELLRAYADRFGADDDATLVLLALDGDVNAAGVKLVPVLAGLGLDDEGAPDMLAAGAPPARVAAVLGDEIPPSLASHSRFDADSIDELRALAEMTWSHPPISAAPATPAERFYGQWIAPGDLVFDVGANLGNRSETFLALGAKVVAVEPQAPLAAQLRARWDGEARLTLVEAALSDQEGTGELYVADAHTVTTMARDFIDDVTASGRFAGSRWDDVAVVPTTTLAALVERHGVPSFCKIDVEGFEPTVLAGLDRPLPVISIEFCSERLAATRACLDRLAALGPIECAYSLGETLELAGEWTDPQSLLATLEALPGHLPWGDVYIRIAGTGDAAREEAARRPAPAPAQPVRPPHQTDGERFMQDLAAYRAMPGGERAIDQDLFPQLGDWREVHELDPHYFHQSTWAMNRIAELRPQRHVDIGSQVDFVGPLTAITDVTFVDIRPLQVDVPRLTSVAGSILELPFADRSLESVSSMHVVEHIGLGRYGDPLDPQGSIKAMAELQRVVAPGGHLLFTGPMGRSRVQFNAHRVHDPLEVLEQFQELEIVEFSIVDDHGRFHRMVDPVQYRDLVYGCGMLLLRRPA